MANSRNYPSSFNKRLNIIGAKIQEYREAQNLTTEELSNKLLFIGIDIPAKSLYHIEIGTRTIVDFEICAIAKVLNIPVSYLLEDYYNSLNNS